MRKSEVEAHVDDVVKDFPTFTDESVTAADIRMAESNAKYTGQSAAQYYFFHALQLLWRDKVPMTRQSVAQTVDTLFAPRRLTQSLIPACISPSSKVGKVLFSRLFSDALLAMWDEVFALCEILKDAQKGEGKNA